MEPWPRTFLLLPLLLLWLQGCVSGPVNENLYRKVWRREGETLSVQCSYKNRRNFVEAKSWCKVKRKKCDHNFTRSWVRGPSYSLRDDAKVKVVRITMEALRVQDSGRYWCMRNTAGHFYPLVGFQLEVYPALTTERNVSPPHLTNTPVDGFVTTGQVRISDPHAPLASDVTVFTSDVTVFASDVTVFTSDVTVFTSGPLTLASGTTAPTPVTHDSFTDTSGTVTEPERSTESQPATLSPSSERSSSADPVTTNTMSRHQSSSLSTTGTCHPLTPNRSQETYIPAMVVVLTFLPAPVVLVIAYGFWKKRHMGRYNLGSNYAKPWIHLPEGPETLWKPAWSKITQ
ncbi:trem-like transcript 2 protein isoform X1 [Mus pahari]|uniref:trem-like transcript 2 protein isoform X1 n=1 Tax=Mus pahari TaxID=10093 RepID=UPI000A30858D|nr:trem-like transcript 2 protein isoform X1 [Mus pahari]